MYIPTIGLEIHIELKTDRKMFCSCKNDPEETKPNTNVCPICLAHPGVLPTINRDAVEAVLKAGYALKGTPRKKTHFDRKSYFYPDLPKGYQISQYDEPLIEGGMLHGIRITRIHLEEDTGRLVHTKNGDTLVDYNRAGVPLMELVTEPDVKNAEEAVLFAKELQRIMRYIGISNADMERGQMRIEANVSLMKDDGTKTFGTKTEVKNINSFKAVHDAIEYEIERQEEVLDKGEKVIQETRGWNDKKGITESQRSKESAHDYRYFPEPDLPPLSFTDNILQSIQTSLPELPEEKRNRFVNNLGIIREQAELLVEEKEWADFFENAVSELEANKKDVAPYQLLYNYLTSDVKGLLNDKKLSLTDTKITPASLAELALLVDAKKLSSRMAKDMLPQMHENGVTPKSLMQEGMQLMNDEATLKPIAEEIIAKNPKAVEDFRNGKTASLQFLFGQLMGRTKGKADPDVAKKILTDLLS